MSPRPRFSNRLDTVRNAVIGVVLRPFRWVSPRARFTIGFIILVLATTFSLSHWPFGLRTFGLLVGVTLAYLAVWRFVIYRAAQVDLLISTPRAFALIGSAILFQTAVMRAGFALAVAVATQSTRAPFSDPFTWSLMIPFAAAALLLTMLTDRQLALGAGLVTAAFA